MCGRYLLKTPADELKELFALEGPLPNFGPRWNVAPTQEMPVVRRHPESGARVLSLLRWGLVPHWADDAGIATRLLHARAEGLETTRSYRDAYARRRCLVPADGFFEWQGEGKAKVPYAVARADGGPFAMAGLWEGWRGQDGTVIRSFTVVTTAANDDLRPVHPRMPVILAPADWPIWLGEVPADAAAMARLLAGAGPGEMRCWPVSSRVGNVRNDDAALFAPLAA
ncbi:SOS response-associated peptidase [Oleomonas cavernae]|uniref:Abasic site processing protein n=1 Tax=Oleomonas cavernae TaxID=2320859 RepID=A0A418VU48_9PROT|nr:SOS response-associated peptidase [Oleomonas cavernae]RJF80671.1 SOS response-associated peptidase [Oleomonas cavernae]